jgi:hypothetical protein
MNTHYCLAPPIAAPTAGLSRWRELFALGELCIDTFSFFLLAWLLRPAPLLFSSVTLSCIAYGASLWGVVQFAPQLVELPPAAERLLRPLRDFSLSHVFGARPAAATIAGCAAAGAYIAHAIPFWGLSVGFKALLFGVWLMNGHRDFFGRLSRALRGGARLRLVAFGGGSVRLSAAVAASVGEEAHLTAAELILNAGAVAAALLVAQLVVGAGAALAGAARAAGSAALWAVAGARAGAALPLRELLVALAVHTVGLPFALHDAAAALLNAAWAWAFCTPVYSRGAALVAFPFLAAGCAVLLAHPSTRMVCVVMIAVVGAAAVEQVRGAQSAAARAWAAFAGSGARARAATLARAAAAAAYLLLARDLSAVPTALLVVGEVAFHALLLPAAAAAYARGWGGSGDEEVVPPAQGGAPREARPLGAWRAVAGAAGARGALRRDADCAVCMDALASRAPARLARARDAAGRPWADAARPFLALHCPPQGWASSRRAVALTSCGHVFHASCLLGWEAACAAERTLPACPTCRGAYATMPLCDAGGGGGGGGSGVEGDAGSSSGDGEEGSDPAPAPRLARGGARGLASRYRRVRAADAARLRSPPGAEVSSPRSPPGAENGGIDAFAGAVVDELDAALGGAPWSYARALGGRRVNTPAPAGGAAVAAPPPHRGGGGGGGGGGSAREWSCRACTYLNKPEDQACEMCETPRGL